VFPVTAIGHAAGERRTLALLHLQHWIVMTHSPPRRMRCRVSLQGKKCRCRCIARTGLEALSPRRSPMRREPE